MTQYAAIANTIPLTLKYDECGEGFLISPKTLNTDFDSVDDLCNVATSILNNPRIEEEYKARLKNQVITSNEFYSEVNNIIINQRTDYCCDLEYIDTKRFRASYIERLKANHFRLYFQIFGFKLFRKVWISFPFKVLLGCVIRFPQVIISKVSRAKPFFVLSRAGK